MKNLTQISVTGEEPGDVGRSWTTQDLMGYNGRPWRGFQESELIRLALEKFSVMTGIVKAWAVLGSRWMDQGGEK